ncbi:hypothetical protein [Piscirickettsia litoralis]|uniref:Uncharacterized protein n=1 Tax=Piscirickettsia litoralis TaxID=1891921 RepID=A0ABX3A777_9GAMM|nr:hypothetical protein [Piscirickettsia litoralis]ODN43478.1 hypothetical protein BGC07_11805 [Piscirickettsia litoralis]
MPKEFQQGNNNHTQLKDKRIIKSPVNSISTFETSYDTQVKLWNEYYAGTGLDTAEITNSAKLSTPYIDGEYPDVNSLVDCIVQMLKRDFVMQDCQDRRNFIADPYGNVFPIDFGQVHTPESSRFYDTYKSDVLQQLRKLTKKTECYRTYDDCLAEINEHKNKELLKKLCKKAETKVHNRRWTLGGAGKRVNIGTDSFVVPGHLAKAIKSSKSKITMNPEEFQSNLLDSLRQHKTSKVKWMTSRDVWTQDLYDGKTDNPSVFFQKLINDKRDKAAYSANSLCD